MTCGTWNEYRGYRWRVVHVPFGRDYDRRRPYQVEIEGLTLIARTLWPSNGRNLAEHIIDRRLRDEE